jgi:hypothetical protein
MERVLSFFSYGMVVCAAVLLLHAPLRAESIDFEGVPAGTILEEVSIPGGKVEVFGLNPSFTPNTNAAVVFDSSNPTGGDLDLGTPNEAFAGPGVGAGGTVSNNTPLGNILILGEDLVDGNSDGLVDDPDDADLLNMYIDFDFVLGGGPGNSKKKSGTVTINSVTLMDIEAEQGESGTFLELSGPGLPTNMIAIPPTGNNGVATLDGIGLSGVNHLRVNFNGSGAVAAVTFNIDQPRSCWLTTGGFLNAGFQSGGKDYTFGGNIGPPPSGSLEVVDHNTGDNFHTNDIQIVECLVIPGTGPQQPGGKQGFDINKATFTGTGRINGVSGYPFDGYFIDAGEPSGKKSNDSDYFEITIRHPVTNAVIFQASGPLDGGNVQIHPPNPSL